MRLLPAGQGKYLKRPYVCTQYGGGGGGFWCVCVNMYDSGDEMCSKILLASMGIM